MYTQVSTRYVEEDDTYEVVITVATAKHPGGYEFAARFTPEQFTDNAFVSDTLTAYTDQIIANQGAVNG